MALALGASMTHVRNSLLRLPSMRYARWYAAAPVTILPAISIGISGWISDVWEGILRAVPKKKTSHMKKRHRQLAGKALQDLKNINTCPGCGKPKKAHTLCPYCVSEIQTSWREADNAARQATKEAVKEASAATATQKEFP